MKITGSVIGSERVERKLESGARELAMPRVRNAVHALGYQLERKVKLEKLNGQVLRRRTGRLVRSINTRFRDTALTSIATVGTNVSYGRIWEITGSREFRIVPSRKKALFWKGAAHPVRSVLHPAQAPRPFLRPALNEMRPTIRATIEKALAGMAH